MARSQLLALVLAALMVAIAAASAPTFCKCTCFKNSTIIPLGPASQLKESSSSPSSFLVKRNVHPDSPVPSPSDGFRPQAAVMGNSYGRRSASTSCSECTKAFCLGQGMDFCKEAKEENVMTHCFQRDSNKDKIIVWAFILGTVALLGWAAFKRIVEWREGRAMGHQAINYTPVAAAQ
ncbi:hypothetical protein CDD83_6240 [Cordyceps sp. RAO-2017]|nr:hypothetical protein CDD83_6240 [Cordyceps sp. RAO-2017]